MMHSGRDGAKVLAWPASHLTVKKLDWMKRSKAGVNDSGPLTLTKRNMERLGTDFFQQQKLTEVFIPPYSMYVARGDLVLAGAAHNGSEPNVRSSCSPYFREGQDSEQRRNFATRYLEIGLKLVLPAVNRSMNNISYVPSRTLQTQLKACR
jgi:hypothetical protein